MIIIIIIIIIIITIEGRALRKQEPSARSVRACLAHDTLNLARKYGNPAII